MKTLIVTYSNNGQLPNNFGSLLSAVDNFNIKCDVAIFAQQHIDIENYDILDKIYLYTGSTFDGFLAENIVPVLSEIASNYTHILMANDSFGKDVLPRLAGVLSLPQLSEVVSLHSEDTFSYSAYAGNIIYKVKTNASIKLMTIRSSSFSKYKNISSAQVPVEHKAVVTLATSNPVFVKDILDFNVGDLTKQSIIVTGGKSLLSQDNFNSIIGGLASKLNAGVGASRAAVEEGFISNSSQIGQTGISVSPELYIAVGISGAMQHIAGMKDSKCVIAINNDENAQIFEYADYGIVADLFEIVPELTNLLK